MGKYLCIVADDFGMHPAVNEGIAKAFSEGLVTDSNLMPPTPAFKEAVGLTKALGIPVGLHATFTCDWDIYSWGPLTEAASFITPVGRFKDTTEEAWKYGTEDDALRELYAQYEAIKAEGIPMTHVGEHMDLDQGNRFAKTMARLINEKRLPHKGEPKAAIDFALTCDWTSGFSTHGHTTLTAAHSWLKATLENLTEGHHLWVSHPAVDHDSLNELCSAGFHARHWARTYRTIDLALLLDEEIAGVLNEHGVEIRSLADCPVSTKD